MHSVSYFRFYRFFRQFTFICFLFVFLSAVSASEGGGFRPPSQEQLDYEAATFTILDHVSPEPLAYARLAVERQSAQRGKASNEAATDEQGEGPVLPLAVDNSATPWFPPIRNQGGNGSCVSFNSVYYMFTYLVARELNRDVRNSGNADKFSPKFVYNMVNWGNDNGSGMGEPLAILRDHGAPTWADWPYDGNFRAWPTSDSVWRSALRHRAAQVGQIVSLNNVFGRQNLKQHLANGNLATIAISSGGVKYGKLGNDPSTTADDSLAGQHVVRHATGTWDHCWTLVGYNDEVWTDLNGNSLVDPGEKGAFKAANSWGTGFKNNGFVWIAYDALPAISSVQGVNMSTQPNRTGLIFGNKAYWMTVRPIGSEMLTLAEITLNTARRNQVRLNVASGPKTESMPYDVWTAYGFRHGNGGSYGYSGTTSSVTASLVIDVTELLAAGTEQRTFLSAIDSFTGSPLTVSAFRLTDGDGATIASASGTTPSGGFPLTADQSTVVMWADLIPPTDNTPPATISDLRVAASATTIMVEWTAPGNNSKHGKVAAYDLRRSSSPITAANFNAAQPITLPSSFAILPGGATQHWATMDFSHGENVWFAVRARDEAGNWNACSNSVAIDWPSLLTIGSAAQLSPAVVGSPLSLPLEASGGTPPYGWSIEPYYQEEVASAAPPITASAMDWRTADYDELFSYTFPGSFRFPAHTGKQWVITTRMEVSPRGFVRFPELPGNRRIAVFESPLTTNGAGDDIWVSASADSITIRWKAHVVGHTGPEGIVDAQLILHASGDAHMSWYQFGSEVGTSFTTGARRRIGVFSSLIPYDLYSPGSFDSVDALPEVGSGAWMRTAAPPRGVHLNPVSGVLHGTPLYPGQRQFTVAVTDSSALTQLAQREFTWNVLASAPQRLIQLDPLPVGWAWASDVGEVVGDAEAPQELLLDNNQTAVAWPEPQAGG